MSAPAAADVELHQISEFDRQAAMVSGSTEGPAFDKQGAVEELLASDDNNSSPAGGDAAPDRFGNEAGAAVKYKTMEWW